MRTAKATSLVSRAATFAMWGAALYFLLAATATIFVR